ncbi:hypothetical protein ABZY58_12160 [Micromonospora tulbaghiae]|uniref:hypothetical protein n=1 Tax=Micromonospora tulbaghiae TaxID=479978 RepID=UPI0033AC1607
MSDFDPDAVPSMRESKARAEQSGIDWRTFRTVLYTVVLPIALILAMLVWAIARHSGELS